MRKLFIFLVVTFSVFSCTQDNAKNLSNKVQILDSVNYADTFKLTYIDTFKNQFVRCGTRYTYDSLDISGGKYLFLSNVANEAIIQVNGNVHILLKDSAETMFEPGYYKTVFKDSLCKIVIVDLKKIKKYSSSSSLYQAKMSLIQGGFKRIYNVHGIAGCWGD
jgi:hypothetical protein